MNWLSILNRALVSVPYAYIVLDADLLSYATGRDPYQATGLIEAFPKGVTSTVVEPIVSAAGVDERYWHRVTGIRIVGVNSGLTVGRWDMIRGFREGELGIVFRTDSQQFDAVKIGASKMSAIHGENIWIVLSELYKDFSDRK
jgi:hypothetical protein